MGGEERTLKERKRKLRTDVVRKTGNGATVRRGIGEEDRDGAAGRQCYGEKIGKNCGEYGKKKVCSDSFRFGDLQTQL